MEGASPKIIKFRYKYFKLLMTVQRKWQYATFAVIQSVTQPGLTLATLVPLARLQFGYCTSYEVGTVQISFI